jgi:hypothetical protein
LSTNNVSKEGVEEMTDKKISPISARAWIGREVEGNNRDLRLFVDSITRKELYNILDEYPDIKAVYFGHVIINDIPIILELYHRIRIIIEVDITTLNNLPGELRGMVEIILRLPSDIIAVKVVKGDMVGVKSLEQMTMNKWNGTKVYKTDKIILGLEFDDITIQG